MKRYGNLWPNIINFENLLLAARKAEKGKRFRPNVLDFNAHIEAELFRLRDQLNAKTYSPGAYRTFEIVEPKRRLISAAPYRDRVVHHALCNIIVPLLEPSFIHNTYANRLGKGSHKALNRFTQFAKSSAYVLQCDIQKYFPSIDHKILKQLIHRKLKCPQTLWLIDTLVDGSNEQIPALFHFPGDDLITPLQRRRGLPVGNLTSQFFANFYLNGLDHFVQEQLGISKYLRYVDDFALFADDPQILSQAKQAVEGHLVDLRLKIHPIKSHIHQVSHGSNFLGFRVFPSHRRVRTENLRRGKRRLRQLQRDYVRGEITQPQVDQSWQSWDAHLRHGDTWHLRQQIFTSLASARG